MLPNTHISTKPETPSSSSTVLRLGLLDVTLLDSGELVPLLAGDLEWSQLVAPLALSPRETAPHAASATRKKRRWRRQRGRRGGGAGDDKEDEATTGFEEETRSGRSGEVSPAVTKTSV